MENNNIVNGKKLKLPLLLMIVIAVVIIAISLIMIINRPHEISLRNDNLIQQIKEYAVDKHKLLGLENEDDSTIFTIQELIDRGIISEEFLEKYDSKTEVAIKLGANGEILVYILDDNLDTEPPIIILKGNSYMTLEYGSEFKDPGVESTTDNKDGNVINKVTINGNVNTRQAGQYIIIYTVKDNAGNVEKVTRIVVIEPENEMPKAQEERVLTNYVLEGDTSNVVLPGIIETNVTRTITITGAKDQHEENIIIKNIKWGVVGNPKGISIDNGVVTITSGAKEGIIEIKAIADRIEKIIKITIEKKPELSSANIMGSNSMQVPGTITVTLDNGKSQYGEAMEITSKDTVWSIIENPENVSINDGVLTVSIGANLGEIIVKAQNGKAIATKKIMLEKIAVNGIKIYEGEKEVTNTTIEMVLNEEKTFRPEILPDNSTIRNGDTNLLSLLGKIYLVIIEMVNYSTQAQNGIRIILI